MKNFRLAYILLLVFLTVFFNIERLDIQQENTIDIGTFVYIITIIAILSVIVIRRFAEFRLVYGYIFWFSVYFIVKLTLFRDESFLAGGVYVYLSITELVFLGTGLWIAHYVSRQLTDLEAMIKNMTLFGSDRRLMTFENSTNEVQLELYRSRRFNTPLAVIVFQIDENNEEVVMNQGIIELQKEISRHYSIIRLARLFNKQSRRTDLVLVKLREDHLVILSPGITRAEAEQFVSKLEVIAKNDLNLQLRSDVKVFPEEGQTFEGLYNLAIKHIGQQKDL